MPDAQDYAARKTEFVSGHTGSSVARVNLVCLTAAVRLFPL